MSNLYNIKQNIMSSEKSRVIPLQPFFSKAPPPSPHKFPDGLELVLDFITEEEEKALMERIDQQPWSDALKRRVQHYGWRYNYAHRQVTPADRLGPLPDWLQDLTDRVHARHTGETPDQVIINEYLPGQGISAHIDLPSAFGPTVATLSLGHAVFMQFTPQKSPQAPVQLLLPRRSLCILRGDSRYKWTHAIVARHNDRVNGTLVPRQRRMSVTFRSIIRRIATKVVH